MARHREKDWDISFPLFGHDNLLMYLICLATSCYTVTFLFSSVSCVVVCVLDKLGSGSTFTVP